MIIEISIAVIAFAFVILVVYLVVLTKALRVTLEETNQTLAETRKQLTEIGFLAQKTIEKTNQVTSDLKQQVESLNPVFNAINQAGRVLEDRATAFKEDFISSLNEKKYYSSLDSSEYSEKKRGSSASYIVKMAAVLELAGIGISLWQKLKKRR